MWQGAHSNFRPLRGGVAFVGDGSRIVCGGESGMSFFGANSLKNMSCGARLSNRCYVRGRFGNRSTSLIGQSPSELVLCNMSKQNNRSQFKPTYAVFTSATFFGRHLCADLRQGPRLWGVIQASCWPNRKSRVRFYLAPHS